MIFLAEGQEVLTDCNLDKSQEAESVDSGEDMKEHNQPNEEAGGKVEREFWKTAVALGCCSSDHAMRVVRKLAGVVALAVKGLTTPILFRAFKHALKEEPLVSIRAPPVHFTES